MKPDFDIPIDIIERARTVKLLIVDVDGVLTDGSLYLTDTGMQFKAFHSRDGLGLKLIRNINIKTAIITARTSESVQLRVDELGIDHLYQGAQDKHTAFEELSSATGIEPRFACYVGDDIVDLPVMKRVGLSISVADAHPAVKEQSHWITPLAGGKGAVRQICDLLLYANGQYGKTISKYLNR
ncbi:MAG: 3-deoxy-D-manno-octulosonate 8-phosphate phosphatase [marine bacterium B5-7]|nr:MAG: 3-deoxy-D-manno-octulosonate 8-phosphate phosphatase [marine bacterium B5-7]